HVTQVLEFENVDDVLDMGFEGDLGGGEMHPLPYSGDRRGVHLMPRCPELSGRGLEVPAARPPPVNDHDRRHFSSASGSWVDSGGNLGWLGRGSKSLRVSGRSPGGARPRRRSRAVGRAALTAPTVRLPLGTGAFDEPSPAAGKASAPCKGPPQLVHRGQLAVGES